MLIFFPNFHHLHLPRNSTIFDINKTTTWARSQDSSAHRIIEWVFNTTPERYANARQPCYGKPSPLPVSVSHFRFPTFGLSMSASRLAFSGHSFLGYMDFFCCDVVNRFIYLDFRRIGVFCRVRVRKEMLNFAFCVCRWKLILWALVLYLMSGKLCKSCIALMKVSGMKLFNEWKCSAFSFTKWI